MISRNLRLPSLFRSTTFNYEQGSSSFKMQFEVICNNIPVNSYVSFSSGESESPLISYGPVKVTNAKVFSGGLQVTVPSGYKGDITFNLYSDEQMTTDSNVSLQISYSSGQITGFSPTAQTVVKHVTTTNS